MLSLNPDSCHDADFVATGGEGQVVITHEGNIVVVNIAACHYTHGANFAVTSDTEGCRWDNLRRPEWRQSQQHHDNSFVTSCGDTKDNKIVIMTALEFPCTQLEILLLKLLARSAWELEHD